MEFVEEIRGDLDLEDLSDFIFSVSVLEWQGIGETIMVQKNYWLGWVYDFY